MTRYMTIVHELWDAGVTDGRWPLSWPMCLQDFWLLLFQCFSNMLHISRHHAAVSSKGLYCVTQQALGSWELRHPIFVFSWVGRPVISLFLLPPRSVISLSFQVSGQNVPSFLTLAHPTDTSWLLNSIRTGCIARGATVSKAKSNHGGERETLRTQACPAAAVHDVPCGCRQSRKGGGEGRSLGQIAAWLLPSFFWLLAVLGAPWLLVYHCSVCFQPYMAFFLL